MVDKIFREVSLIKPYPKKIIIGENAFNKLVEEMKSKMAIGLNVNLKGEYTTLWGMVIEIDKGNKDKIEYVCDEKVAI